MLREFGEIPNAGQVQVRDDKQKLSFAMDVRDFAPEEIQVRVADNCVSIEGKHEEKQDEHGYVSRYFQRRYVLPRETDPSNVVSRLSSDGILTVEAPKRAIESGHDRQIPVQFTGQPALSHKKEERKAGSPAEVAKGS